MTAIMPPISYFGGKTTLAPRIAALFPPHLHYVEPFCGSLAVLLAKSPSRMETVNDLSEDLVTFWRVLRDRTEDLVRVCGLTPHSRLEQESAYDRAGCDELERARRVWVCLTQARGGTLRRTGWRYYRDPSSSYCGMPAYLDGYLGRMPPAAERLKSVTLECRPAMELIEGFGAHPSVLLYVDPPYLGSTRGKSYDGYQHEMRGEVEHRELADALLGCRASVVLSGYPSALYDQLYSGWDRVEMAASTGQGGTWANRTEVLWSNRSLGDQQGLWGNQ
jgi:DNA adenine methylase